jgi:hypothetical protein
VGGIALGAFVPARARSPWLGVAAIVLGGAIAAVGPSGAEVPEGEPVEATAP